MITNFNIFKNGKKEKDSHPDYRLSAQVNGEYVEIGAGWIKGEGDKKYISCKLTEPYEARNGFHIEMDLAPKQPVNKETEETPSIEFPEEEINAEDIPF